MVNVRAQTYGRASEREGTISQWNGCPLSGYAPHKEPHKYRESAAVDAAQRAHSGSVGFNGHFDFGMAS